MNLQPRYFPVSPDDAMRFAGAVMRALWVEERNIADEATLANLLAEQNLPAVRMDDAHSQAVQERYERDTERAIEAGVFGAPSYVIEGEIFWGQDRLEFVERRLAAAT